MIRLSNKTKILNFFRKLFRNKFSESILIKIILSKTIISKLGEKLVPSHYLYKSKTIRNTKIKGISLTLDISDYINHLVYFQLDNKGNEKLSKIAKGCKVILDVGTNIGFTALSMSKYVANDGIVHAFEPDPYNFSRLRNNVNLNPNRPIVVNNKGLGHKEDQLKLVVNTSDNRGGNRIDSNADEGYNLVDITTIDLYCQQTDIKTVDLIKIDVEGFEYNVLKGAIGIIESSKPTMFIEIDDNNLMQQGSSAKEVITLLENYYSSIFDADNLRKVSSSDDFRDCHFDIIARNEN